jgi:hypothetical protein
MKAWEALRTSRVQASSEWALSICRGPLCVRPCIAFYIVLFVMFWMVAIGVTYAKLHANGKPFTWSALVFDGGGHRFSDFSDFDPVEETFTMDGVKGQVYPAPMIDVYLFFTRNFEKPLHKYLLFIFSAYLVIGVSTAGVLYRSRANGVVLAAAALMTICASYPFVWAIERANMESVVFLLEAAALAAFFTRRHLMAGLLIAIAASMKIFPGVLFALLLARKRYWELAVSLAVILPLEVVSLWILGPSISAAYASVRRGLANISRNYFLGYPVTTIGYDHSLFAVVKQILHLRLRDEALGAKIFSLGLGYSLLMATTLLVLYWFRIRKLPLLNQAMVLLTLSVTFPYLSFEYTLTAISLVWAMFVIFLSRDVTEGREQIPMPAALAMLGLMAFLFAPANFITGGTQIYGGQFKALALLALAGITLSVPMRSALFDSA